MRGAEVQQEAYGAGYDETRQGQEYYNNNSSNYGGRGGYYDRSGGGRGGYANNRSANFVLNAVDIV